MLRCIFIIQSRKEQACQKKRRIPHWRVTSSIVGSLHQQISSCTCNTPWFYLTALLLCVTFRCAMPPRALKCLKLLSLEKETPSGPDVCAASCSCVDVWSIFLYPGLWRRGDRPDRVCVCGWAESGCSSWPCQ